MDKKQPLGELTLRTLAMPADTNAHGDIFGGWIVSQMDLGGAILARQYAKSRVVTIAIDKMVFKQPVQVGETISVYGKVVRVGRTSIEINIQVWSINHECDEEHRHVTEGIFTFVAINEKGRPHRVQCTTLSNVDRP